MKKNLFLMLMAGCLFASCEGPPGRDGLDGAGTFWFVDDYPIRASDWELIGGVDQINSYYQAKINVPKLTRNVYEDGNVFCYMYQTISNVEVQTPLPFTIPKGNENEELWTEIYSFDFSPGEIMFYFNCSDFYTNNHPPATTFRVVLNY